MGGLALPSFARPSDEPHVSTRTSWSSIDLIAAADSSTTSVPATHPTGGECNTACCEYTPQLARCRAPYNTFMPTYHLARVPVSNRAQAEAVRWDYCSPQHAEDNRQHSTCNGVCARARARAHARSHGRGYVACCSSPVKGLMIEHTFESSFPLTRNRGMCANELCTHSPNRRAVAHYMSLV